MRGLREADLKQLQAVSSNIRFGTLDGFDGKEGVAIGTRLANELNVKLGDQVTLLTPRGASTALGTAPRVKRYPIVADLRDRHVGIRSSIMFMPLAEAQRYFTKPDSITVLEVVLDSPDEVSALGPKIIEAGGSSVYISDWRQRNATFFTALQVERNVMFLILTLIVLVAALNIISGLIMLVKDKGHDIAILRTMGATRAAVMRIFFITGASIGVVGTLAGLVLGVLVCAQHRADPRVRRLDHRHRAVLARALLSVAVAGRDGHWRDRLGRDHGARAVGPRHALSLLAGLSSRSGRSVALRVGRGSWGSQIRRRRCISTGWSALTRKAPASSRC